MREIVEGVVGYRDLVAKINTILYVIFSTDDAEIFQIWDIPIVIVSP